MRNGNGNEYIEVRDLGTLGIYLNGDPIKLFRNTKVVTWYRFRADGKRTNVSQPHVEIFRDSNDSEEIKSCFDNHYRDKMC